MSDLPPFPDHGNLDAAAGAGLCDFCAPAAPSNWGYPCRSFPLPDPIGAYQTIYGRDPMSHGDWGACERCAALIEAGDRNGLARRQTKEPELVWIQRQIIDRFFDNRIDAPRYPTTGVGVVYPTPRITPF